MKPLLARVAAFVSWHRRAVAALLAGLSVVLIASWLDEPDGPGVPVPVTSAALPAGHTIDSMRAEACPGQTRLTLANAKALLATYSKQGITLSGTEPDRSFVIQVGSSTGRAAR